MNWYSNAHEQEMFDSVRDSLVQFATMRSDSALFLTLERAVVITGPPELVALSNTGEIRVLRALVDRLGAKDGAWAAEVILAAMTGHEADIVISFATDPQGWWDSVGKTARPRWAKWLAEVGDNLVWDVDRRSFIEIGRTHRE
jgi:hypothetical protein